MVRTAILMSLLAVATGALAAPPATTAGHKPHAPKPRKALFAYLPDQQRDHDVTGDVLSITGRQVLNILFLDEPCPHPDMEDSENFRRAWDIGMKVGCWAPTTDGAFVFYYPVSQRLYPRGESLLRFVHGDVSADGNSVRITEPDYDSRTYDTNAVLKIMKAQQEQMKRQQSERP